MTRYPGNRPAEDAPRHTHRVCEYTPSFPWALHLSWLRLWGFKYDDEAVASESPPVLAWPLCPPRPSHPSQSPPSANLPGQTHITAEPLHFPRPVSDTPLVPSQRSIVRCLPRRATPRRSYTVIFEAPLQPLPPPPPTGMQGGRAAGPGMAKGG